MPTDLLLAQTRITEASHNRFAALSGDLNPIHADPAAAKFMEPGALLAYGMDMVLWSLESLATQAQLPTSLARLRARFVKWVYLEEEVTLRASLNAREGWQAFDLLVDEASVATLELFSGERTAPASEAPASSPARRTKPRELTLEQMNNVEGIAAVPDAHEAASLYPQLTHTLTASAIAELATCSYIIGMEAPGLYSMSMRYDLQFTTAAPEATSNGLHFQVVAVDDRFRKAKIAVTGTHIRGTLEAVVRPA